MSCSCGPGLVCVSAEQLRDLARMLEGLAAGELVLTPAADGGPPLKDGNGNGKGRKRFVPPTLQDIEKKVQEKGLEELVDPVKFLSHYRAVGWKQKGGLSIVDWEAALVGWAKRSAEWRS